MLHITLSDLKREPPYQQRRIKSTQKHSCNNPSSIECTVSNKDILAATMNKMLITVGKMLLEKQALLLQIYYNPLSGAPWASNHKFKVDYEWTDHEFSASYCIQLQSAKTWHVSVQTNIWCSCTSQCGSKKLLKMYRDNDWVSCTPSQTDAPVLPAMYDDVLHWWPMFHVNVYLNYWYSW